MEQEMELMDWSLVLSNDGIASIGSGKERTESKRQISKFTGLSEFQASPTVMRRGF